jgi:soluble lytic murein transglycosylase-like protein
MAKSKVGARGLMQLMPQTAALVARSMNMRSDRKRLHTPEWNLTLGQNYIRRLMNTPQVGDNLIWLLVSYNAGPGNLNKWTRQGIKEQDPLFFIEALPSRETRDFVKKVLVNFWIYRSLLGQDNPSLDELVAGLWPQYRKAD